MNADANAPYTSEDEGAGLGARFLAYAVDSAVLFGVSMLFATAGFLVIFLGSDSGRSSISESQELGLLLLLMATLPAWYVLNVFLTAKRGYTIGQYVMGLRISDETGERPALRRAAAYWVALHPLIFHPIMALPWLLFALIGVTRAESQLVFVLALCVAFLCLAAPVAGLLFILVDPRRRAIHDRLAGLKVVRL